MSIGAQMTISAAGQRLFSERYMVALGPLPPRDELRTTWLELEARADATFFTSWFWIGTWLETLRSQQDLSLLMVRNGNQIAGLAIIGLAARDMRKLGRRAYVLHQTGQQRLDVMYIEYNDFLLARDTAPEVRAACLSYLTANRLFRAQAGLPKLTEAMTAAAIPFRVLRDVLCHFVDLAQVPVGEGVNTHDKLSSGTELFLQTLGRNSRHQIRRAIRLAEASGPLQVWRQDDVAAARSDLAEMARLHTAAWQHRKGQQGAFRSAEFNQFVERLVENGVSAGVVDLLRIGSSTQSLGYLLNFVYRGEVYAYQSGFVYEDDNRLKPGLVCHALAISHYRARDCRGYHFMAGAGRYKATLSNGTESLVWLESRPDDILSRVEDICKVLWDTSRRLLK
jgi:CelD/BcsL family acetyltransferase involved in cellulose biosynthesis